MIRPLQLGALNFPVNLIQGPLAGVSSAPFRRLTWRYSQPAFSCTEMISCKTLLHQSKNVLQRFIKKDVAEGPVSFQLAGGNAADVAEAAKRVTDYGADLIDLNCGCPVKKIRRKGYGSRLLTDTPTLYALICALKQNTDKPVSIKIRVQGASDEKFNQEVANVVSDAGADFLVVHGRHWTENYDTPCRFDEIRFFVEALKIPVIGNGDINSVTSLQKMLATGCAGAMISRAGVGQPWLIRQLIAAMQQLSFIAPSNAEIALLFIEHIEALTELLGSEKFSLLHARQLAKYYARQLPNKLVFCEAVYQCVTVDALRAVALRYFDVCHPREGGG